MNKLNKIAFMSLASLLMYSACANAEVVSPKALQAQKAQKTQKTEKTSDEGKVIFRIENIKPIKNKQGNVRQCSYIVTAYNRMDTAIKEATLDFSWQDNITGKYIQQIEDSSKVAKDEITEQLDSDVAEMKQKQDNNKSRTALQFKPIHSSVKFFNIGAHAQKSFSDTVDTDKCFLLFDNLNFQLKDCQLEGHKANDESCKDKFQYISTKNPEYYVEFSDVPESVVQDQIEAEKNKEMNETESRYNDIMSTLGKIDSTLNSMRQ